MMNKTRLLLGAGIGAFVLILAGCASSDLGSRRVEVPISITKGMSVAELKEALGEPSSISPYGEEPGVEIWTYVRSQRTTQLVSIETEEIPYWNPITGVYQPEQRDVMSPETIERNQEYQFLIAEGMVAAWKVEKPRERRRID